METIKNMYFYKDSIINKEIAFILNIKYNFIDKIEKGKIKKEEIFVSDKKDIQKLSKEEIYENVDFISFPYLYNYLNKFNKQYELEGRTDFKTDIKEIEKIPIENLSLSEMLIKVLYSKPKKIDCKLLENEINIDNYGNIWGCCPTWIGKPFGNIINDNDPYNNYNARMIKLSSLNKTFCFCNLFRCQYFGSEFLNDSNFSIELKSLDVPKQITISTDKTCNLKCDSCRKDYYVPTKEEKIMSKTITDKLLLSGWLNKSTILMAGQGEVFLSPNYLKILKDPSVKGKIIKILSNGVLFSENKLNLLKEKFEEIHAYISIDAATKETYNKLRHGNFDLLLKNLKMLGKKRYEGNKFKCFELNFVVQKDNMNEMIDFIKLAKEINADRVHFTKLNNWFTMTDEEYKEKCLIIDNYLNYDLYKILKNPIFKDKIVDISSFTGYIENSKKHYKP